MKSYLFPILLILIFSCNPTNQEARVEMPKKEHNDLSVDHFNLWVKDPQKAKDKLADAGFTPIPDSLSNVHIGQGTAGKYFYFLNCYFEFIYVYDSTEFISNCKLNPYLDFKERLEYASNGASPLGIALRVKDYAVEKIPFKTVRYHQDWMNANASIYAAKTSKTNLNEPSVFVVYPEIESDNYQNMDDLMQIPEEYKLWRSFFKHPNGAKLITKITISTNNFNANSETIQALNSIENLKIKQGTEHFLEVYFDKHVQGKSVDLRPDLPMKVYY